MQRRGLLYEKKILKILKKEFKDDFIPSQWFKYSISDTTRYCQTDGILISGGVCIIVEVKLTYREDAAIKLLEFYKRIVSEYFTNKEYRCVQITRTVPEDFKEDIFDLDQITEVDLPYFIIQHSGH